MNNDNNDTCRRMVRQAGNVLLSHLLPASCTLCGMDSGDLLCPACHQQFFGPAARRVRCSCCANPLPPGVTGGHCGACLRQRPAHEATVVAADYALPLDQLVLQLKFGRRLALAPLLARLLHAATLDLDGWRKPELLCPVPLGAGRLAERGFNQALEIARPLARLLQIPLAPRLAARSHETRAQSSLLPQERRRNLAQAFSVPDLALLRGRHVGIVDDVMTSGQTVHQLAALFKRHGAARVSNLVFARTPPH